MVAQTNGKIYKIQNIGGDEIFIASTNKKYLSQRMDTTRRDFKKWKKGEHALVRCFDIFQRFGVENCVIILLEAYPCESKEALKAREAYYIINNICVNKNIPNRNHKDSMKNWQVTHRDHWNQYLRNRYAIKKNKLMLLNINNNGNQEIV